LFERSSAQLVELGRRGLAPCEHAEVDPDLEVRRVGRPGGECDRGFDLARPAAVLPRPAPAYASRGSQRQPPTATEAPSAPQAAITATAVPSFQICASRSTMSRVMRMK